MGAPYTFSDALRAHDLAFDSWLDGLHVDYPADAQAPYHARRDVPIIRVRATPDRAYASLVETLVSQRWFKDESTASAMRSKAGQIWLLPLPAATWQRGDPQPDPSFAAPPKVARREFDAATGKIVAHPWPGHYMTEYSVTFWCHKQWSEDHCREWVMGQLGQPGADHNQVFIPVKHKAPWNTMFQSMVMTSSVDESEYEGTEPRYKRVTFSFQLRTWVFKITTAETYPITTFVPSLDMPDADGVDASYPDTASPIVHSDNLFGLFLPPSVIPRLWPKEGDAKVMQGYASSFAPKHARETDDALSVRVTTGEDAVELLEFPTGLNDDGEAVFSVHFDFRSTGPLALEGGQRDNSAASRELCHYAALPAVSPRWAAFHQFAYFTRLLGSFLVVGAGSPCTATLRNVNVRRLVPQSKFAPETRTSIGAVFSNLPNDPFLVVVTFTATGGLSTFAVDDDATAPINVREQPADSVWSRAVVLLSQPRAGTLRVRWPSTIGVASVWAQRYYSNYYGNSF